MQKKGLLLCLLFLSAGFAQQAPDLTLPEGYSASLVASGLRGPTQMILGPDGRLWLAQLGGAENAGAGQVLALSSGTGEREVLLDNLFKPTGIALLDGYLWIASGRDLLRAPLAAGGGVGALETVLRDLPFNGRSNGTLTVTPEGGLLFETSGRRQGDAAQPGSGVLWRLKPTDPANPQPLATGLKGAYAHAFDSAGRLFTTEIGDDSVNAQAPPDELNLVVEGADYGWPRCYGNQRPALNYGGTPEICRRSRAPLVTFAPHTTPTGLMASPFEDGVLLVALWGPVDAGVVRVAYSVDGVEEEDAVGEIETFISGLQNPQHLLATPEGLLVSDFGRGMIYRVTKP